jgi:Leucine-rich repeat (LRR) protein
MTDSPICSWLGVECEGSSKDDKGIKSLNLESNNMIGRLPMQAWSLPFLRELNLRGNEGLHVSLLGVSKTTVEYLYLSGTKTETLDGISHLKSLRILEVDGMTGKSVGVHCSWPKLATLLTFTITGPFPSELFDLADNLEVLDLSQNYFVGTIPTRIGELTGLTQLLVTGNDLHGTLPKEVGELTNLEELGKPNFSKWTAAYLACLSLVRFRSQFLTRTF